MKKNNWILAVSIITTLIFISCKKDSNETTTPSLLGQWNLNKDVTWHHNGATIIKDTAVYNQGSYVNYASDGKVYYKWIYSTGATGYDTAYYTINGNSVIYNWLNAGGYSDTLQIQSLTNNSAVLNNSTYNPLGNLMDYWEFYSK